MKRLTTTFNLFIENKTYSLAFICVVAFTLRVFFLYLYEVPLAKDAFIYDATALSLAKGEGYTLMGTPVGHYPPVYSLFLSAIYFFVGHNIIIAKLLNCILGVILCLLCFKLFRYFLSYKMSLLATMFIGLNPMFIRVSGLLLSENLAVPVFICWLIMLIYILNSFSGTISDRSKTLISFSVGIVFGILLLIKGIAVCFFPLLPIVFFYHLTRQSIPLKKNILYFAVSLLGISLVLAPWVARNYNVYGKFVPITTSGGKALYMAYKSEIFGSFPTDKEIYKKTKDMDAVEESDYYLDRAKKYIWNHPEILPGLILKKIGYFFMPLDWGIMSVGGRARYPGYNYIYAFLFPLFLYGTYKIIALYKWDLFENNWSIVLFSILFLFLICMVFLGFPRFRMLIEPLMTIVACHALSTVKENPFVICQRKTALSIILIYFSSNFLIYLYAKPIKIYVKYLLSS